METHRVKKYYLKRIKIFITKKTWNCGVEVIVDNNGTLWLNENNVEKTLKYRNLSATARIHHSDFRKHRCKVKYCINQKKHSNDILTWKIGIKGNKRL